jgi:hypothetical protein
MSGDDTVTDTDVDGLVTAIREAHGAATAARERVAEHGQERLETVAAAHSEATGLLERYESRATGTGDFAAFVEFQDAFARLVEGLDDDLPAREAFEEAKDVLDQRRLSVDDFERAREALGPATDLVERLRERDRAEERLRDARHEGRERLREIEERIERLERVRRLGEADLGAPVERLRDPVASYNERIREAWETFRREESAREVFRVVEATSAYPLVAFRQPPAALREYVDTHAAGEESIPTLLEYADYTGSKLSHYVDDAGALKTRVATHRTYLERLDADPLTVSWPPPPADRLRYRAGELVSVVGRFAPEDAVAAARTVRRLPDDTEYGRLREAALARAELSADQRERLERGAVEADLTAAREALERLRATLDETD